MLRYYLPVGGFHSSELWIQNFVVLNVFFFSNHFMKQAQLLNLFGFFVTLCSINGFKEIVTLKQWASEFYVISKVYKLLLAIKI